MLVSINRRSDIAARTPPVANCRDQFIGTFICGQDRRSTQYILPCQWEHRDIRYRG